MATPSRILITGCTGFVGHYLVEQCHIHYPHATLFGLTGHPIPRIDPTILHDIQIGVTDIAGAIERCQAAGISFELEENNPAPGWSYRRLVIRTPGGYRLALEGPNE